MNQRSTLSQVKAENGKLFMVGTRHAVSEKQRTIRFGMPFPSIAMEIATLTRHRWTFSQSSKYPLCPPETGGRAKRRGYDKKRKRKRKCENSHTPSGTPFLVAPILGGQRKRKTENGKLRTENSEYSEYSEKSDFPAPRSTFIVQRSTFNAQRSTLPHPSRLKHQTKRR